MDRYSYDRRINAFKISPKLLSYGRSAYEAIQEAEKKVLETRSLMDSLVTGLRVEIHRAERDGGDVRNLKAVLEEVREYAKDFSEDVETFKRLGLTTTVGASLSGLTLEVPDLPSLHAVK